MHHSTAAIADAVVALLAEAPTGSSTDVIATLATRGRGLLAHGIGRLTVVAIGQRLGLDTTAGIAEAVRSTNNSRR